MWGKENEMAKIECSILAISVFLPRINALPITITIESARFSETTTGVVSNALLFLLLLTMDCGEREREYTKKGWAKIAQPFWG